ncbi:hypothetical protein MIND_01129200 [Mycena indigotica]|uniref:Uncharacterized protein n=1 Tax=Mycena indigotica TaxID=2126181 RepID=A0A8H6S5J9_9AGAR|nr:uncharacterized protein MIND_01129200 [Mycena indigotica]KAF7293510.1 hypothetical protein MIND_01129200 [Mycena indigotica]
MDHFLFHTPDDAVQLDGNELLELLPTFTRRHYFVLEGTNLPAKLFLSGKIYTRYQDPMLGDTIILSNPHIASLEAGYRKVIEFLQQTMYETLPEPNQNVLGHWLCTPLGADADHAMVRIQIPASKTAVALECYNIPELAYASDQDPLLEPERDNPSYVLRHDYTYMINPRKIKAEKGFDDCWQGGLVRRLYFGLLGIMLHYDYRQDYVVDYYEDYVGLSRD